MGTGQGGGFPDRDGFYDFDLSERARGRFSGRHFRMLSSMLSVAIMVRASRLCEAVSVPSLLVA